MKAVLTGGAITHTDYFESRDHEAGRAWLVMDGTAWHVLLPRTCPHRLSVAYARPVTDCQERDGWRWRLELGNWHLPLTRTQIIGSRPPLPQPYTSTQRSLTLYDSLLRASSGQSFFGSMEVGIQIAATCTLHLVRETRHGQKTKAGSLPPTTGSRGGGGRFH